MTENAYLSNTKFDDEIVERLCIGIRDMPVIREHPNWWVELYVDGFSAHTETEKAQLVFREYKILVVKENSATSQVNQAFDRHPAKASKAICGDLRAIVRPQLSNLDQWQFLAVLLPAEVNISRDKWIQPGI